MQSPRTTVWSIDRRPLQPVLPGLPADWRLPLQGLRPPAGRPPRGWRQRRPSQWWIQPQPRSSRPSWAAPRLVHPYRRRDQAVAQSSRGPEVNWTDRARVDQVGQQNCVPVDCYDDVLVSDEFNRDEPGAHQLKYYARGVGGIRVGWRGAKEEEQEAMVLVALRHLGAAAMAKVREKVLEQEGRAYRIIPDVYGQTERIDQTS